LSALVSMAKSNGFMKLYLSANSGVTDGGRAALAGKLNVKTGPL